jgi:hypothetical protein
MPQKINFNDISITHPEKGAFSHVLPGRVMVLSSGCKFMVI